MKRPQSNGIMERFHRTLLYKHFRVEGRRTWFETVEEMQTFLDGRPRSSLAAKEPSKLQLDRQPTAA